MGSSHSPSRDPVSLNEKQEQKATKESRIVLNKKWIA
jgi:hypothetical protein